ncbi:MAG: DNA-protecting protein DprA [Actinomycetia bacterium]|nr:DNA-protecting protein DprA [Actinomycetes bacterium]MCP4227575.1 DNA-protecting protein DprA [Actinomycetes bacterium]
MSNELAARLALIALPGVGPARLRWLLSAGPAEEVIAKIRNESLPPSIGPAPPGVTAKLIQNWAIALRRKGPSEHLADVSAIGAEVLEPDHARWPFANDPEPPIVLFALGDLKLLSAAPVVAIVGTRRCSTIGRRVASDLGTHLAEAGATVVSGLASGVDGAAHRGVLAAGGKPIGVVGTGLDVVYPAANRQLWNDVVAHGLLLSEAMPGAAPERWRFPARNRLIAGLADVVVIVESHDHGGSMHTVNEAVERGLPVMAVPGSVTNPAASGTNRLLVEGCPPARSAQDVLDFLGLAVPTASTEDVLSAAQAGSGEPSCAQLRLVVNDDAPSRTDRTPLGRIILDQVAAGSTHIDDLMAATNVTIPELLSEVNQLSERGAVQLDGSTVSLASP